MSKAYFSPIERVYFEVRPELFAAGFPALGAVGLFLPVELFVPVELAAFLTAVFPLELPAFFAEEFPVFAEAAAAVPPDAPDLLEVLLPPELFAALFATVDLAALVLKAVDFDDAPVLTEEDFADGFAPPDLDPELVVFEVPVLDALVFEAVGFDPPEELPEEAVEGPFLPETPADLATAVAVPTAAPLAAPSAAP